MLWGWLFRGKPVGFRSHFSSCKSCCLWNIRDADGSSHSSSQPWLCDSEAELQEGMSITNTIFWLGWFFKNSEFSPKPWRLISSTMPGDIKLDAPIGTAVASSPKLLLLSYFFFLSNFWLILKFLSPKDWGVVSSTVIFAFICHVYFHLLWVNLSHIL